jgi:hypothetical protein
METLGFRANCKTTSCAKQKQKSAPKKLNLLHNLCNQSANKTRKTKSGGATPKILTHICVL